MIRRPFAGAPSVVGGSSLGWRAALFAVLTGLFGGLAAAVVHPVLLIVGVAGVAVLLAIPSQGYRVFWAFLVFLLMGYALFGKGFAYIGFSPAYVAEVGLALAAASAAVMLLFDKVRSITPFFRLEVALLAAYVAWQATRTVPYLEAYGVYTVRDAAAWGYAAFAVFILLLVPREAVERAFVLYGRVLPYYLVWLLVAWVFVKVSPAEVYFPGSPVPFLHLKSGDVGVHLAGAAAFMLLRLDLRGRAWSGGTLWLLWGLWICDWVLWGATNRGGMFSALVGIAVVLLWRPRAQWYRPVAIGAMLVPLFFVANFSASFGEEGGVAISGDQIVSNVTSSFGAETTSQLDGTREWRLNWWGDIIGYTFGGDYFWTGKGYGINLATEDGYQVTSDASLRSPHNAHMTVLARSGVPGFILWALFLVAFASTLVRKSLSGGTAGHWDRRYAVWLLAYWLACLVNGSFDVFLEGPMGAVWFWSLVGLTLVYFARTPRHPGPAGPEPVRGA